MNDFLEFFQQRRMLTIASVTVFFLHVSALFSILHALRHVRTSQAAVAWTTGLFTLPMIALPLYWVFARHRFEGYREAIREVGKRHERSMTAFQDELTTERFVASARRATGLEYLADIMDTPVSSGNRFELLIDGSEYFRAVFEAIDAAERYIYISIFIIRDDELGRRLADALIRRSGEGIQVRLLYDEVGCLRLPNEYLRRLNEAGVDARAFNTRQGWVNRFQINFRNHRKSVVVDGKRSIVGGLNVGNEYLGPAAGMPDWRDTGVAVEGPVTRKIQAVFAGDYYWAAREDLPEADWSIGDFDEAKDQTPIGHAAVCATGPADRRPRASMMYAAVASAARKRLWISTPYLVPDDASQVALHMAKSRGVDVRLLIPDEADHWGVYLAGFYYEQAFADAGIPVYRYNAGFLHQKCILVDNSLALIGSTNLDNRSLYLNFELMLASDDQDLVAKVVKMFERDFASATHSNAPGTPIRPLFARAGTAVARLLSPVL